MKILVATKTFNRIDLIDLSKIEAAFINKDGNIEIIKSNGDNFIIDKEVHHIQKNTYLPSVLTDMIELFEQQDMDIVLNLDQYDKWWSLMANYNKKTVAQSN